MTRSRPRVGACFCMRYFPGAPAGGLVPGGAPLPWPAWLGQASERVTGSTCWMIAPSAGLAWVTALSVVSVEHETRNVPRRMGPCASCVENSDAALWLAHETQNR